MPSTPHEARIGDRIAYCRGQLDNLTTEALARYTKKFDEVGISRQSLVRYEAGETLPGARELRILAASLWVTYDWLCSGVEGMRGDTDALLRTWLARALVELRVLDLPLEAVDLGAKNERAEVERRQQWIHEARQPTAQD